LRGAEGNFFMKLRDAGQNLRNKEARGLERGKSLKPKLQALRLDFVFNDPGECNLNMVREFLANWKPKKRSNQVNIRGQLLKFTASTLNQFLGTPHMDPQPMRDLLLKPPYREIRHTLSGPNSVTITSNTSSI
ncbi:hypothetical protein HAX54_042444, partial [Datura stramonium]|nr:hypothetical protein [Datura stramonium]